MCLHTHTLALEELAELLCLSVVVSRELSAVSRNLLSSFACPYSRSLLTL